MGTSVQAIDLCSATIGKDIVKLQAQPGLDLTWIWAHVLAGTSPEECEPDQSRREFKSLAALIPEKYGCTLLSPGPMMKQHRALVCPKTSEIYGCLGGTPGAPCWWSSDSQQSSTRLVLAWNEC